MKWSIRNLQKLNTDQVPFSEMVPFPELVEMNANVLSIPTFKVEGVIHRRSSSYSIQLSIEGHVSLPCVRTLKEVVYPIHLQSHVIYYEKLDEDENVEEIDVFPIQQDEIDLRPYIIELIYVEIPMQVYHEDVQDSDVPVTGNDWQLIDESFEKPMDPRLEALKKLLPEEKK